MAINIILSVSRQPEWISVAKRLKKELGWEPKYWITYNENHWDVMAEFPGVIAHARLDLNRGIAVPELNELMSGALSLHDLSDAANHEAISLEILDRFDLDNSLTHAARLRLIHKTLVYWRNVIERLDLNLAIFGAPPHSLGNYLLYAAMKLKNKKIKIFRGTALNNVHIICDEIDSLPGKLIDAYHENLDSGDFEDLGEDIMRSLMEVRDAEAAYQPWYVRDARARDAKHACIVDKIETSYGNDLIVSERFIPGKPLATATDFQLPLNLGIERTKPIRKRRSKNADRELPRAFKVPGRPLHDRMITLQEYEDYRDWAMTKKIELRKRYKSICRPLPKDKKFVYFAMHYQPERTTCPDGGPFSNHYLCAALLSLGVPEDIEIVIKEHPTQFSYTGMGELCRWPEYYDDFLAFRNVRFVDVNLPSVGLVDSSVAVATVTGAVGWEALVRGTPVFHFGSAWYGGCASAYRIRNTEDVARACQDIKSGIRPTERHILAYAAALKAIGHTVYTTPTMAKGVEVKGDMGEMFFNLLVNSEVQHTVPR